MNAEALDDLEQNVIEPLQAAYAALERVDVADDPHVRRAMDEIEAALRERGVYPVEAVVAVQ